MTSDEQHMENVERLARIEGRIETQNALLEAITSRNRDEITALFAGRREHESAINAIKVDYVPKARFERFEDEVNTKLDNLTSKVLRMCGGLTVVSGLIGWLVSYFGGHR